MRKGLMGGVLVGMMALGGIGLALADAPKAGGNDQAAAMAKWQKAATPGDQHKMLAKAVGKWTAVVKVAMGPGAPAQEAPATAEFTSVLDGRFVRQDFSGSMMGQAFQGVGYTGYDNMKQQYVSTWMDGGATSVTIAYGTLDKDGKSITFTGTMDDAMTGEKNKKVKQILRWTDDNAMVYEMWDNAKGKDWKAVEITYTRAK